MWHAKPFIPSLNRACMPFHRLSLLPPLPLLCSSSLSSLSSFPSLSSPPSPLLPLLPPLPPFPLLFSLSSSFSTDWYHQCLFSGPLGVGGISPLSFEFHPQTITNFVCFFCFFLFFGYSSHFLSPQKQLLPQKYISRKKTLGTTEGTLLSFWLPSLLSEAPVYISSLSAWTLASVHMYISFSVHISWISSQRERATQLTKGPGLYNKCSPNTASHTKRKESSIRDKKAAVHNTRITTATGFSMHVHVHYLIM